MIQELQLDKSSWKAVTFGDVVGEVSKSTNDPVRDGIERVVGLEHIESECIHLRSWASIEEETTFTKVFRKGHVLFGRRRSYLKKAALAEFDGICSGDITVLEAKDGLLPALLPFLVNNDKFFDYAVKHSAGGLSPRTKFKDLANYEFLLPPKDQQAKLAELLWAADTSVESLLGLDGRLQTALKAEFYEVIRISERDVDLSDIGEIVTGSTPSTKVAGYWTDGSVPFVTPAEFTDDPFISGSERTITEAGLISVREVPKGAVLVVCIGATIGKVAIASERCATNQQINAVIPKDGWNSMYLLFALRTFKNRILARSGATTLPIINKGEFSKVRVPKIPHQSAIGLEKKFNGFVEARERNNEKIMASVAVRKALINQIF